MSNALTRILSASASIVLTFGLAIASASASPIDESMVWQTTVHYADLDLSSPADRHTLARRLSIAADRVCPAGATPLETVTCRTTAIADARAQVLRADKALS